MTALQVVRTSFLSPRPRLSPLSRPRERGRVFGQIKAADQKYCHKQRWRRKLKEISFRTRRFGDNLDDFWPRYCTAKVLDLSCVVEAYL